MAFCLDDFVRDPVPFQRNSPQNLLVDLKYGQFLPLHGEKTCYTQNGITCVFPVLSIIKKTDFRLHLDTIFFFGSTEPIAIYRMFEF